MGNLGVRRRDRPCGSLWQAGGGVGGAHGGERLAHLGGIVCQKGLIKRLLAQAKEQGVGLVGPGGLLNQFTRSALETALKKFSRGESA